MNAPMFPNIVVRFSVHERDSEAVVHSGHYRLADGTERRAFGQRCHEAIADGYEIRTWKESRNEP